MGAFSEMELELGYEDDPFAEDCDTAAFSEIAPVKPVTASPQSKETEEEPVPVVEMSEDEKRKAHEESEAKRKAEWEARQQQKKAAEKEQLDRLAAMSDEEVMASSMKRVGTDTEKLTRRNMKECVSEHVQTLCLTDPTFARKVSHPRKSMIHCFQYINRKAWEYVQDELKANGIKPGPEQQMYGSDIPDGLCYQWAEDYFNDPEAKEDHAEEEKFVPRPYCGGFSAKSKSSKKKKSADKPAAPIKKAVEKKPSENAGQISFGGFVMPEEKAG